MHPPTNLFALSRHRPAVLAWHSTPYRSAHAAAFSDADSDDHPNAGPSRPRRRMEDYRFPESGKRGGKPDPYEVLGLERAAAAGQIKAQCELKREEGCVRVETFRCDFGH